MLAFRRKIIGRNNPLERLNARSSGAPKWWGIFPNEGASCASSARSCSNKTMNARGSYMSLETIAPLSDDPIVLLVRGEGASVIAPMTHGHRPRSCIG